MANNNNNSNNVRLNGLNPLAYMGVNPYTPVPLVYKPFDPTPNDYANFTLATIWLNTNNENIWMLVSKVNYVSTWVMIGSASGDVLSLSGDDSVKVYPLVGNISILGKSAGATVEFTGSVPNTLTFIVTDSTHNTIIGNDAGNATYVSTGPNTGLGDSTLHSLTSGGQNTALGYATLYSLTVGAYNVAVGNSALTSLIGGTRNTAIGTQSLGVLSSTSNNTAVGYFGMSSLITGSTNSGLGVGCFENLLTGTNNTGIGFGVGSNYTGSESNNILVGSGGLVSESDTIRIGIPGTQTSAYIAGIAGVTISNENLVTINTVTGQLGSVSGTGAGTVTSLTEATGITLTPSTITTTGSIGLTIPVVVSSGGTGDTSFTAYAPIVGGTTTTGVLQSAATGISNSGYVLTSTGSSSIPTWQASGSGVAGTQAFSYYMGSNLTFSSTSYYYGTTIVFTENFDNTGGNFYPGSGVGSGTTGAATFTVPTTGLYNISMGSGPAQTSVSTLRLSVSVLAGTLYGPSTIYSLSPGSSGGAIDAAAGSGNYYLSSGQVLYFSVSAGAGGSNFLSGPQTYISGYRIA